VRFIDLRRPDGSAAAAAQQPASSDSSQSHFAHLMVGHRGGVPHPQGAHSYYMPQHYAAMMQMQGMQGAHYMMQGYPQHMAAVMGYPPHMDPSVGQSSDGGSRGGRGSGGRRTPSSGGPGSRRGLGSAGSSDSLSNISDASATDHVQHSGAPQMHPAMMSGDPAAMAAAAAMGHPQQYLHPAYYPMYAMPPMPPPHGRKVGRGVADPSVYQHKLFVGQVPFEAAEQDLWHLFAPYGDILELAVLRSGGVSKGCAFLTYGSRSQAMHAMTALHGHQVGTNKRLVVKFADHKPNGGAPLATLKKQLSAQHLEDGVDEELDVQVDEPAAGAAAAIEA
jgi:cold-inducible RNA-binding protein